MQVFDQKIAPARPVAEQLLHLEQCGRVDPASFGRLAAALPAGCQWLDGDDSLVHGVA
jgi:hypothetical protein